MSVTKTTTTTETETEELAEDDIDLESLQAQIDLSMSFAQDLVSTWVSTKSSSSSRNQKLERELQEYIRRPPRLGVGASVPETVHSVTREAARLRGKLVGGKRQRGEDAAEPSSKPETDDDDDGESRVKAIRKKVKLDPFAATHGKKKKSTGLNVALQKKAVDHPPMPSTVHSIVNNNDETDSPSKKRKKKKKLRDDEAVDEPSSEGLRMAVGSPPHTAENSAGSAVHIQKHSGDSIERSAHETTVKKQDTAMQSPNQVERMLIANASPTPSPRKTIHPELLKIPLLNLSGPVQDEEDSGPESPSTPKKKRKRRKKRKHLTSGMDAGTSNAT